MRNQSAAFMLSSPAAEYLSEKIVGRLACLVYAYVFATRISVCYKNVNALE